MKTLRDCLYRRTKYWTYLFRMWSVTERREVNVVDLTNVSGKNEHFIRQDMTLSYSKALLLYNHLKRFFAAIGEEQQESVFVLQDDENTVYGIFWDIEGAIREAQRYAPAEKVVINNGIAWIGDGVFTVVKLKVQGPPTILSIKES